jgi:hypothetical protein
MSAGERVSGKVKLFNPEQGTAANRGGPMPAEVRTAQSMGLGRDNRLGMACRRDRARQHNAGPTVAGLAAGSGLNDDGLQPL